MFSNLDESLSQDQKYVLLLGFGVSGWLILIEILNEQYLKVYPFEYGLVSHDFSSWEQCILKVGVEEIKMLDSIKLSETLDKWRIHRKI